MIRTTDLLSPVASPATLETARGRPSVSSQSGFAQTLAKELSQTSSTVRFSNHAQQRLASRGISLSNDDLQRIGGALDSAASKGARESLVLMDRLALVVNVPERTVITAMSTDNMESHVFTNIDSAVVAASSPTRANTTLDTSFGPVPFAGGLSAAERLTRRIS